MRTSFTLAAAAILGALVATGNAQSAPPADQEPAKQRANRESVPTSAILLLHSQPDERLIPISVDRGNHNRCCR